MSGQRNAAVRLVVSSVRQGRVGFNQVVMEQQQAPAGVMLVAIDKANGLYVWLKPFEVVAAASSPQAPGYSRALPSFEVASPPAFLGPAVFIPASQIPVETWNELPGLKTNALNRALRQPLGFGD
jgi:hypothetical protein